MLSYRHSFHAGNFADVLKHLVLVEILEYLRQKNKPFDYIDTHAGAGLYDLQSPRAQQNCEHQQGVVPVKASGDPLFTRYLAVLARHNGDESLRLYPGSPSIAIDYLSAQDRAWLFELHPDDYEKLARRFATNRRVYVRKEDGLPALIGLLPPQSKRALVLIDPSYEVKQDYQQVVETLIKAHRRFATGIYALWYPVVERERIQQLEHRLQRSGIRRIHLYELGLQPDHAARGMTGAGMIVINPPWTLHQTMQQLLPPLVELLDPQMGYYRCLELVGE